VDTFAAIILALVQGLTEFLPISSSAHLILVPRFFGWADQGLAFDVAVHFGTLLAVAWYFRGELAAVAGGWGRSILRRPCNRRDARLGWNLLIGSAPLIFSGLIFADTIAGEMRSPMLIAATTALFGILLWLADLRSHPVRDEHDIGLWIALLIGIAQAVALIPGTSRSGITITAGLAFGLSRPAAARFSFLLAIPAIAGAVIYELWAVLGGEIDVDWAGIGVGFVVATLSAYFCIRFFLRAIQRTGMLPFMVYRLLLAALIIVAFI